MHSEKKSLYSLLLELDNMYINTFKGAIETTDKQLSRSILFFQMAMLLFCP